MNTNYGPAVNARLCKYCGKPSKDSRAQYCSHECHWESQRNKPWAADAIRIYKEGAIGFKRLAKQFGVTAGTMRNALLHAGVLESSRGAGPKKDAKWKPPAAPRPAKPINTDALIMSEYFKDQRCLARFDEERHWGGHNAVSAWYNRKLYHERPDIYAAKARRQWDRIKHDPSLVALKYARTRSWIERTGYNWKERRPDAYRKWKRQHRDKHPELRALHNLRKRVRDFMTDGVRRESTSQLVGCTQQQFREHIASQFKRGMSWDNYGEWHVDHIIPCAVFDQNNKEQRLACWHFTNLQPLWAEDNLLKSDATVTTQPELTMCYAG